jgi:hypothetical protein
MQVAGNCDNPRASHGIHCFLALKLALHPLKLILDGNGNINVTKLKQARTS